MRKGTSIMIAAAMLFGGVVFAKAGNQNDAGCGLGSQLFKDNQPVPQILAATTNGSFGTQTFGITTGTLGCSSGGLIKNAKIEKAQENFVAVNIRDLKREIAAGGGEYVASLSSLMGCSKETVPAFSHFTQAHYQDLFASDDASAQNVLSTLRSEMGRDSQLSASCTTL